MTLDSPGSSAGSRRRCAVVDDEPFFCELIAEQLTRSGFEVSVFHRGAEFLASLADGAPEVVLLDLRLDGETGLDVCRKLRLVSAVPVIMLTGVNDGSAVVACLEAGADDYVLKPYEPDQLVARIRAVLRRAAAPGSAEPSSVVASFADITLDTVGRIGRRGDAEVKFAEREFGLLAALIREYPQMLDRERCSLIVLRRDWIPGDRALDVLLTRIREKLRTLGSRLEIVTLRARGFALHDPQAPDPAARPEA
jgi:DNA-binding response OmpR family regulator